MAGETSTAIGEVTETLKFLAMSESVLNCSCHWLQPVVGDEFFLSAEIIRLLAIWEGEPTGEPILSRPADLTTSRFAENFGAAGALPSHIFAAKVGAH